MSPWEHESRHPDGVAGGGRRPLARNGADIIADFCEIPQSLWARGARGAPYPTYFSYLGQAALHPFNLLALIGLAFLALILWSLPVLFVGVGAEGVFLLVIPRCPLFRQRVDKAVADAARATADRARELMVIQMAEVHRQELARLEVVVNKTFANVERRGLAVRACLEHSMGLRRLTDIFIRLAISYRACEESLSSTNVHVLEGTIRSLEAALPGSPARTRPLLQRRLSVAHRRHECLAATREDLDALGHQLATIVELIHLVHQESLAPVGSVRASEQIDEFLSDIEGKAGALRELSELGIPDDPTLLPAFEVGVLSERRA